MVQVFLLLGFVLLLVLKLQMLAVDVPEQTKETMSRRINSRKGLQETLANLI